MVDWTIVETQADIDALDREVCGFHDSCIVGMEYKSGSFVNRDGSMTMTWRPEDYCLLLSLESQLSGGVVELLFSGLRRFHLAGLLRNRDCSIQSGYLAFHEGMIPGDPRRLIVWADRSHQGRFHLTPVINGSHVKPYPADFRRSCEEAMCRPKAYNDLWSALF